MKNKPKDQPGLPLPSVLPILLAAGIVLSLLLVEAHTLGDYSTCTLSKGFSCKAVMNSPYSSLLGVSLAQWGLFFYLSLLLLAFVLRLSPPPHPDRVVDAFLLIALGALLFSVYLGLIYKFKIKSFCPCCVGLYAVNHLLFITAWRHGAGGLAGRLRSGLAALAALPREVPAAVLRGGSAGRRALAGSGALLAAGLCTACAPLTIGMLFDASDRVIPESELELRLEPGANQDYYEGRPDAPVRIVVFSDIECPICRRLHGGLQELVGKYEGDVLLVYKNYPLDNSCNTSIAGPFHENSCYAALFARCAGEQGRFWPVLDRLYALPELEEGAPRIMVKSAMSRLSESLGLDEEGMQSCLAGERYLPQIQRDIALGDKLGLKGTPLVFINGREVTLASTANIERIIRRNLERR